MNERSEQVASAVQGHIKALRLLGREETSIAKIADALRLKDNQVQAAFRDYKISGAGIDAQKSVSHVRMWTIFSPVVSLKQRGRGKASDNIKT